MLGPMAPRFAGLVAYRALVPRSAVEHLPVEVTNRVGPEQHPVSCFVGRDRAHYNLVCVVPERDWHDDSWTAPGVLADLRAHFATWSDDLRDVLDSVVEPVFKWALYDREPLASWRSGNVVLIGDACHPMLPFMAQGACQAMEDAAALSRLLDGSRSTADALRRYETMRRPRASDVQRRSWTNCTTFRLPDGFNQRRRDEHFASMARAGNAIAASDWLFGHDPFDVDV